MLRPRGSPLLGRTPRSSSMNSLHTLTTLIRSVAYVSTRNAYLIGDRLAFSSTPGRVENKVTHSSTIYKSGNSVVGGKNCRRKLSLMLASS
jgi:hypothetical protein